MKPENRVGPASWYTVLLFACDAMPHAMQADDQLNSDANPQNEDIDAILAEIGTSGNHEDGCSRPEDVLPWSRDRMQVSPTLSVVSAVTLHLHVQFQFLRASNGPTWMQEQRRERLKEQLRSKISSGESHKKPSLKKRDAKK